MALAHPLPDLFSLDLLRSVAEAGSITEAALLHGMSQPAVSMRLRDLERMLGVTLLDRRGGRARLSDVGVAVLGWAEKILGATLELQLGIAAIHSDVSSRLELAASMTVAEYLIPGWLALAQMDLPEVDVSLRMGNSAQVVDLVRTHQVDMGFVEGRSAPTEVNCEAVLDDVLVVVVSPRHFWATSRRVVTPAELAAMPLLLRESGSGTREVLETALRPYGLSVKSAAELSSTTAIKAAIKAGVAPAVLSRLAVTEDLEAGRLVEIAVEGLDMSRAIRVVWARESKLTPVAQGFLDMLRRGIKRTAP